MLNIKPISELRNYTKLLEEVKPDDPVFLTKNGYGKYVLVDIEDYDRFTLGMKLSEMMKEAKASGTMSLEETKKHFGISDE